MKSDSFINRLAWIGAVLVLVTIFSLGLIRQPFSPDSWTNLEMSQRVFGDFYLTNTRIQFQLDTPYATGFPPLTPILMAVANEILDVGVYSGSVVNFLFSFGLLFLLMHIFARLRGRAWLGVIPFAILHLSMAFIDEIQAGRSVVKNAFFITLLFYLFISQSRQMLRNAAFLGIVAGLMALNRYDMTIATVAFSLAVFMRHKKASHALIYTFMLVLVLSPWMYFSLKHFGRPIASEAFRMLKLAFPNYAVDYFPEGLVLPTLFTHPEAWVRSALERIGTGAIGLFQLRYLAPLVLLSVFIKYKNRLPIQSVFQFKDQEKRLILWFLIIPFFHSSSVVISGLPTARYFAPELILFSIIIVLGISCEAQLRFKFLEFRKAAYVLLGLLLVGNVIQAVHYSFYGICGIANTCPSNFSELSQVEKDVAQTINANNLKDKRFLVVNGEVYSYRFGALTGFDTFISPSNANDCIAVDLINRFHIDALIFQNQSKLSTQILRHFDYELVSDRVALLKAPKSSQIPYEDPCDSQFRHLSSTSTQNSNNL